MESLHTRGLLSLLSLLVGCSGGSVDFGDGRSGHDFALNPWPDSMASAGRQIRLEFAETQDPRYEMFVTGSWEGAEAWLALAMVPRVQNLPVVLGYMCGGGTPYSDQIDGQQDFYVASGIKAIYEISTTEDCGVDQGCLGLVYSAHEGDAADCGLHEIPDQLTLTEDLAENVVDIPFEAEASVLEKVAKTRTAVVPQVLPTGPSALVAPSAASLDDIVILWGRNPISARLEVWRFDVKEAIWTKSSAEGMPESPLGAVAHWTGEDLFVLSEGTAHIYAAKTDEWSALASDGAPNFAGGGSPLSVVATHGAGHVFVYGSQLFNGTVRSFGAKFEIARNEWRPLPETGAPNARDYKKLLWTGNELTVWSNEVSGQKRLAGNGWVAMDADSNGFSTCDGSDVWLHDGSLVGLCQNGTNRQHYKYDYRDQQWDHFSASSLGRWIGTAETRSGYWTATIGGFEGDDQFAGGNLYHDLTNKGYRFPHVPELARSFAAVTWVGKQIFVFGGCDRLTGFGCLAYRSDGVLFHTYVYP